MDCDPKVKRSKKSDKAKEKIGRPSAKHVRLLEAAHVKVPLNIKLSLHPNRRRLNFILALVLRF
jgi:hypothetical protein